MELQTTLSHGSLEDIVGLLRTQADVKYDVVVPASSLRYENGRLHVAEGATRWNDDGATLVDAVLDPTSIFEDGVADRLGIPRQYLRKLRETGTTVNLGEFARLGDWREDGETITVAPSLLDANVNGWLQSLGNKRFLVRAFRTDNPDEVGIARALLSNRFAPIDGLDVVLAALKGVSDAGLDPTKLRIDGDITERNLRVRITAPEVTALAPVLLGNYRNPFARSGHGQAGLRDEGYGFAPDADGNMLPIVEAGLVIGDSETGGGAFTLAPRFVCRICGNGATVTSHALPRQVHLGGTLDDGLISWSEDTHRKTLDLVVARTRDAVQSFLSTDFLNKIVAEVEETAGTPVDNAVATIERVSAKHLFSDAEQASILDLFIKSGDLTAGGVMQAVTAAAQTLDNPDRAAEFEDLALDVLATAATV